MSTPHIGAEPGEFAPAVLMPGDPQRATHIAERLMPDARLVSDVRGILAYTGTHQGRPLSVMASGMGMPSMSIYATELFRFFDVQRIVRVGTAGGMSPRVAVRDVIIGLAAHTDSAMTTQRLPGVTFSHTASYPLVAAAVAAGAETAGPEVHVGALFSSDTFYADRAETNQRLIDHGALAVEMEAAGLYACAAAEGREALAVVTVSDHLYDHSVPDLTAAQRATDFDRALTIAVAAAFA